MPDMIRVFPHADTLAFPMTLGLVQETPFNPGGIFRKPGEIDTGPILCGAEPIRGSRLGVLDRRHTSFS
jgi:hypothetical protein